MASTVASSTGPTGYVSRALVCPFRSPLTVSSAWWTDGPTNFSDTAQPTIRLVIPSRLFTSVRLQLAATQECTSTLSFNGEKSAVGVSA